MLKSIIFGLILILAPAAIAQPTSPSVSQDCQHPTTIFLHPKLDGKERLDGFILRIYFPVDQPGYDLSSANIIGTTNLPPEWSFNIVSATAGSSLQGYASVGASYLEWSSI